MSRSLAAMALTVMTGLVLVGAFVPRAEVFVVAGLIALAGAGFAYLVADVVSEEPPLGWTVQMSRDDGDG